jgi:class 3 adenylate cyclase
MREAQRKNEKGRLLANCFPIVLLLLPFLAVNMGYRFFAGIDLYWQKNEQQEIANQEIEALAAGSDFSYQFARLAGDFTKKFKGGVEADLQGSRLGSYLEERSRSIFCWPFPEHELFTFYLPEKNGAGEVLYMRSGSTPRKRVFSRAFEHLVKVNKGESANAIIDKQNEKMVAGILGGDSKSDVIARTQRGKASFAFYNFFPHWFLWEYFEVPGKGTFGYFLFTRNDDERRAAARLLALKDLKERRRALGAFLPLYSGFGGAVMQEPLAGSRLFRHWARQKLSRVENDLKSWLEKGTPPVAELGNFHAYSFLGKGHTHLTVLLLPSVKAAARPLWLFMINLIIAGIVFMLLARGLILGQWPVINLRFRFIATYLLAATLPVSLLIISVYGYVTQYRKATHFQALTRLQFCIKQFDARKAQIHDEYRSAFSEVFRDEKLKQILSTQGARSEEARDRILGFFKNRSEQLPLLSFAIMDENGDGARYYGGQKPAEADPTIEAFRYPLVMMLRRKILANNQKAVFMEFKASDIQRTSVEAYKSMTRNDLVVEVDKRRSFAITRQVGGRTVTQIHDTIKIDGQEKFVLFLVWDDQALDEKTFRQSVTHFGLNNSDFSFVAYRVTPQGLTYLAEPDRHAGGDFLALSRTLADQASFRGSYAGKQYENLSLVAMPSKKYDSTIIVGGTRHFGLEKLVANRLFFLAAVLALAISVVLLCSFVSARIILDPITGLKSALDNVAAGKLNIEIISRSHDELGILCKEFSVMTKGLRDREKLATLISDQAVAAISRSETGDRLLTSETFRGVALVSDIRNFTGLCEEHAPDLITGMLNEHFAQMARIISENGGRIYKFIGDAIEAVFPEDEGSPEEAATRAFSAASQMLHRLARINQVRAGQGVFCYRIGVGLAYGEMHAGTIGSLDTRLDYAIIGDPLKNAARLESMSTSYPQFPLIIDKILADKLAAKGIMFAGVC